VGGKLVAITKITISSYYKLYYQPIGTVQKVMDFDAINDHDALDKAREYCLRWGATLVSLRKISEERLLF
jgi:hypothetical protein